MVQARLHVELSEGQWKADISQRFSDHLLQILSMVANGGRVVEIVEISGCNTDACLSAISSHSDIGTFEIVERHSNRATVQLATTEPAVLFSAIQAGTPILYPIEVELGELIATVVGTHEIISSLGDQFQADGFDFEVAYIQSNRDVSQVLTERQAEVLFTAIEHGYYRCPRQCTLTEISETLDIAKSTCSGTLKRAEKAVIEYFCLQQQRTGQDAPLNADAVSGLSR
ncbi:helix-turn-helix domain-containing protein [Halovenus sp. HT40]|uniref:helix-turn-helix domain-containing protein n=1 Tax=Halovenus sp. HT40 TaxID=3126691 RepID=UPI00300F689F